MIRDFEKEDARAVVALLPECEVWTPRSLLHRLDADPPRAHGRYWVVEDGGAITGFARARLEWATAAADVGRFRIRPVSDELLERVEQHLSDHGARVLRTYTDADGEFFERHGYRATRHELVSVLEPRRVGVPGDVVPLRELAGREREQYELARLTGADMPADEPEENISYEEWLAEALAHPDLSPDGSFYALDDGRLAAFAWLIVDGERRIAGNEMTGTHPDFRGRGLATRAKLATIRWAAENGISKIYTSNDQENLAMLAINRKLDYRQIVRETNYER